MALDLEQINLLPNDHKIRYMALERVYQSEGWKFLLEWARLNVEELKGRVINAPNWEQTCFARGGLVAYDHFLNLEKITETEYAAVAEAQAEAALDTVDDPVDE